MGRRLAAFSALVIAVQLSACERNHTAARSTEPPAYLRVDSTQYTVRLTRLMFRVDIPYAYTNRSGDDVSQNYCYTPSPPLLEKEVSPGQWARAYNPAVLLCETLPPFRIRSGRTFRSVLHVVAAPPGRNVSPYWQVDSVPGIYRLHWVLHAAANSGHPGRVVDATSASFRLMMQ